MQTRTPHRASSVAAINPVGPDPTIKTSVSCEREPAAADSDATMNYDSSLGLSSIPRHEARGETSAPVVRVLCDGRKQAAR